MNTGLFHDWFLAAHPSITDPVRRQQCAMIALFHLLVCPITPCLYLLSHSSIYDVPPLPVEWLLGALIVTILSYILMRSRWMNASMIFQVAISTLFPLLTSFHNPHSQAAHFALIIGVILSSVYFDRRVLLSVVVIIFGGLFGLYLTQSETAQHLLAESIAVLAVTCILIVMARMFHEWLDQHHQRSLKAQLVRFEQLLSASFQGTARLVDGELAEVSKGFTLILDKTENELNGKQISEFLPSVHVESKTLSTHSYYLNNGEIRYVELLRSTLEDHQELIAVRDITNQTLEQVKQLQMDRVIAAGTLASGIAHELNTPLMVAMNQTRILTERIHSDDVEDLTKRLGVVDEVLHQMASIISDLKWFVQTSAEDSSLGISTIIENTLRLSNHRIRHELDIEVNLNSTRKPAFSNHNLIQLLTNFLFNAAGARRPETATNKVRITTRDEPEHFVLEVQDFGIGMSKAVAARVFEPFYTHGKRSGTGLGLAICQNLIAKANGRITIDTALDQGCKITVKLPFAKSSHDDPDHESITNVIERVLVVDDDPQLPKIIGELLGEYECLFASNTDDALAIIDTDEIDAVVCDVNMPCGGAQHLFGTLQYMHHPLTRRFIVITGGAVSLSMQVFIDQTDKPVLFKPFRAGHLLDALSALSLESVEPVDEI
ncbi:MAG: ATP-binding protein [Bradymonadia bacterium]